MEPEDRGTMDLCGFCDKLLRAIPCDRVWFEWTVNLLLSASTCRLCDFLASCLADDPFDNPVPEWTRVRDILVPFQEYTIKCLVSMDHLYPPHVSFYILFPGSSSKIWFRLGFWADEGSAAASRSEFETTAPPSDCSSTNKQINAWLDYCREEHAACVSPMNPHYDDEEDVEPELPRRVLDVGETSTPSTVRLVEANGLHGHYVALSHCWGPPDKHPLRTTTATLDKHLKGIEFEQLPKTFQDAAIVTRALGLKYLWIDSLCILQDNENEWREEVGKMGSLYQLATLTVAASGAHDSTEGCYMSKNWSLPSIRIPYYNHAEDEAPSGYINAKQHLRCSPAKGPLHKRAWAVLEWHSSRRTVHLTGEGLSWQCNETSVSDTGPENLGAGRETWYRFLQDYTRAEHTYGLDRLVALQGAANAERNEGRRGRYCFGTWTADLPGALVWMKRSATPEGESHVKVPSWSWASRAGPIYFWTTGTCCIGRLIAPDQIHVDDRGTVEAREAKIERLVVSDNNVDDYCVRHRDFGDFIREIQRDREAPLHYIHDAEAEGDDAIGVAALDCEVGSSIFGLAVMGYSTIRIPGKFTDVERSACNCSKEEPPLKCARVSGSWILLLEEVPHSSPDIRGFKRVGLGLVSVDWTANEESRLIRII